MERVLTEAEVEVTHPLPSKASDALLVAALNHLAELLRSALVDEGFPLLEHTMRFDDRVIMGSVHQFGTGYTLDLSLEVTEEDED